MSDLAQLLELFTSHHQPVPDDDSWNVELLPPEHLLDRLRARYTPAPIPPCRVCGAKLEVHRAGGGEPAIYACTPPDGVTFSDWQEHYQRSRYIHTRPGDSGVLALLDGVETLILSAGIDPRTLRSLADTTAHHH